MAIGATLRQARVQKGLSLDGLAKATKVQARMLDAIERDARAQLPPRPYTRGMVAVFAREVGLDPEQTVRDYFAELGPGDQQKAPPAAETTRVPIDDDPPLLGTSTLLIAAILVVGVVIAWNLPGAKTPDVPQPVGTSGPVQPAAAAAVPAPAPPVAAPPAVKAASEELTVVLEATRPAWVAASADGRRVVYRVLRPGERETLRAAREITLRTGNAGAVTWTVNGRSLGAVGRSGAIRDVTISPANADTIR